MKLCMHPVSMTSRPVRMFIADNNLDVDGQVIDLMTGEHHKEPFASINPVAWCQCSRTAISG
jgi:glutathione S-transferase